MVGIVSYGAYIPRFRIDTGEIARVWGEDPNRAKKSLLVESKAVAGPDEDACTMAVEASRYAIRRWGGDPADIDVIYVGSESHPYAVKPTASILADALGASPHVMAVDLEFACKAGTAGLISAMAMVKSGMARFGLAVGSDTAQGAPGDALEYTAASGAAAFIVGSQGVIARLNGFHSVTTDTPDFWRRAGRPYPRHGGRFTGQPAYFKHILMAARGLMEKMGTGPEDYDFAIFHQPNTKFPLSVGRRLGFPKEKILPGIVVNKIGNTYAASMLIGLARVLDRAEPGQRILAVSFGSGAGSDAFDFTVTENIEGIRVDGVPTVDELIGRGRFVDYAIYAKYRGKILMGDEE